VFELLGVSDPRERDALVGQLHEATARHFREIRVVEIEKMEQRARSAARRFNVRDLASDIWDAAELADTMPLAEWVARSRDARGREPDALVAVPEERPAVLSQDVMFAPNVVYFGRRRRTFVECTSRGQAELVERLATLGVSGDVRLPSALAPALQLLARVDERVARTAARFRELAETRTGDERVREQLVELLLRWFVLGREDGPRPPAAADAPADDEPS
jgi:hypothetical protein